MGLIYAEVLMIALVALTYGSGLPLMYGVVCLVCVVVYWTEKHKFLKVYSMPVEYGKRITSLFVRVLRVRPPPPLLVYASASSNRDCYRVAVHLAPVPVTPHTGLPRDSPSP